MMVKIGKPKRGAADSGAVPATVSEGRLVGTEQIVAYATRLGKFIRTLVRRMIGAEVDMLQNFDHKLTCLKYCGGRLTLDFGA